ncbi:MAG: hypothetical protein J0I32_19365 [Sphingobacteriales bacterium]|nr:hypothetical protein [Sphingobacteriales bacterium]OJV98678.1 MAG: hypothetical protein BGO52_07820 [Sphingobacteriales bacterium 44-61]
MSKLTAPKPINVGTALLVSKGIAHRQTASVWLKKLVDSETLRPEKKGRTTYYINYRLVDILSNN